MKLLDLFSGAGGAAMGYYRTGFTDIIGVDIKPMPRYPFTFVQADALEYLAELIRTGEVEEYSLIHASPPCQFWSEATPVEHRGKHPQLIAPTRTLLQKAGRPYVIENVAGARRELINPIMLCGTMFQLPIWRHRYFEVFPEIFVLLPPCRHDRAPVLVGKPGSHSRKLLTPPVHSTGGGDGQRSGRKNKRPRSRVSDVRLAMNIDWMGRDDLSQAIPPAYCEFIGKQMARAIKERA